MTLKIHVLAWNGNKNVAELNRSTEYWIEVMIIRYIFKEDNTSICPLIYFCPFMRWNINGECIHDENKKKKGRHVLYRVRILGVESWIYTHKIYH
jgi:hypothetical protein